MKPKPWGCAHYSAIALMCFALLCYVAWECLFRSVPLRIAPETTYITEPLDASGKWVDYFRAMELKLYPAEMKTDENGVRVMTRALGIGEEVSVEGFKESYYEKLGLDPSVPPTHFFLQPHDYFQRAKTYMPKVYEAQKQKMYDRDIENKEETDYATWEPIGLLNAQILQTPWMIEENPLLAHWLNDCSAALDIVAEAVQKPAFMFPWVRYRDGGRMTMITRLMPNVQAMRYYARGLNLRANHRIAQGDFDGAFDDIITCFRLGRLGGHEGSAIGALAGFSIEGSANAIDFNFPSEKTPTIEQLQRLLHEIDNLPLRVEFETVFEAERFLMLETVQSIMMAKTNKEFSAIPWGDEYFTPLLFIGTNWNTVFRKINETYDQMLAGIYTETTYDFKPWKMLTLQSRSEFIARQIMGFLMPTLDAIKEAIWRTECTTNLKRLILATLIYEKEHGTWPDSHPLHSWRVLLLPYLGEQELYENIRLDEPWDSEHNRQFHEVSLSAFQCPSANQKKMVDGGTHYSVILRDNPESGSDKKNMLLIVERQVAICWMKPDEEITQQAAEAGINKSPTALGSHHPGGFNAATKAGGVRFISNTIDSGELQEWIVGTDTDR